MKSLLMGLLMITTAGLAEAASTDTVEGTVQSLAADLVAMNTAIQEPTEKGKNDLFGLNFLTNADIPAEEKVVEIHMATPAPLIQESRRNRKAMPFSMGTCSGSFIDDQGDILTAKHCVTNFTTFMVQTYDHRTYKAVVVATSTVHDLAILHIARRNTPFFEFASDVRRGEDIYVLGSPLGITDVVTQGIIAKLDGDDIILDCGVLPGNSGGPVINTRHELVGVAIAGYVVMLGTTHLNIAQSLDAVVDFVEKTLGGK